MRLYYKGQVNTRGVANIYLQVPFATDNFRISQAFSYLLYDVYVLMLVEMGSSWNR